MKARSAAIIILATFLVACSSVPRDEFQRIEFIVFDPENITVNELSKGQAAATGAAVGAASGLVYSALFSLLCGPYFAVCFAGAPAVVGASAVAGGVYGGISDLAVEYDDGFGEFMHPMPAPRDLNQKLVDAVKAQLPPSRIAEQGNPDVRLILSIYKLRLRKKWGNLYFDIRASMVYEWELEQEEPKHARGFYSCLEKMDAPEDWPQGSHQVLSDELDTCVQDLSDRIYKTLMEPPVEQDIAGFSETPY